MNRIEDIVFISPADHLSQLTSKLDEHLKIGEKCEAFFQAYNERTLLPRGGNRENALMLAQVNHFMSFSKMFAHLSDKSLEQWEAEHVKIGLDLLSLESEEKQLITQHGELKEKFDLCKKVNTLFTTQIPLLIQNGPDILLDKGNVFFLRDNTFSVGGIGECYCCEFMSRSNRNMFSRALCSEANYDIPKENPLTIASIGVGQAFHELEIHTMFSARGYKVNQWVLVDPMLVPKTAQRFETIVKWQNSDATVLSVEKKCDAYFTEVQNGNTPLPDIFLFIDVDLHISTKQVAMFISKMKHRCLFGEFSKELACSDAYEAMKFTYVPPK